ncbi:GntR family transcriptional regulator [Brevibacillus centrosporus]|uniref:GntR family transcriptional regulator n=1 Tax=Brevibacillus centrosporus TaxID=54910 RepID=UPI002E22C67F|nr:GntR family transcriptional regulator [Brevibacillus centrosporus]
MAILIDGWSIVPQFRKCGKVRCKTCEEGNGHGPYYYGTKLDNGKKQIKYFGRKLPVSSEKDEINSLLEDTQEAIIGPELNVGSLPVNHSVRDHGETQKRMIPTNEEEIYKGIKQAIIQQQLRPNMQLVEEVLAESFGVSRTPVRNVLRRLAQEKLVTIIPYKGTFVSCLTVQEAKEVYEARKFLEAVTIRQACKRLTDEHVLQLKTIIEEEHEAHSHEDSFVSLRLSCDIHLKIAEIAGNSYNYRYLEELISLSYVIYAFYGPGRLFCGSEEHTEILHALKQRDESLAERLMLEHLNRIESLLNFNETLAAPLSLTEIFKGK